MGAHALEAMYRNIPYAYQDKKTLYRKSVEEKIPQSYPTHKQAEVLVLDTIEQCYFAECVCQVGKKDAVQKIVQSRLPIIEHDFYFVPRMDDL